jgi:hypothetical protein
MRQWRRFLVLPLALPALSACATGEVDGNYDERPEAVERETGPPSQEEIDRLIDEAISDVKPRRRQHARREKTELDRWIQKRFGTPQQRANRPRWTTCVDVTSYDYNWDNDMQCTRPDGTVFYTDYAGAATYQ